MGLLDDLFHTRCVMSKNQIKSGKYINSLFGIKCLQLDIEIRDGDRCASIIHLVQVTLHFTYDVISLGNLDDEASCFQVTLQQAVGHRGRFEGHDQGQGHWFIVVDIVQPSFTMICNNMFVLFAQQNLLKTFSRKSGQVNYVRFPKI